MTPLWTEPRSLGVSDTLLAELTARLHKPTASDSAGSQARLGITAGASFFSPPAWADFPSPTFPAQHPTATAAPAATGTAGEGLPRLWQGTAAAGHTAKGGGVEVFGFKVLVWAAVAAAAPAAGAEGWRERRMGDPGRSIIPGPLCRAQDPAAALQEQNPSLALKEEKKKIPN